MKCFMESMLWRRRAGAFLQELADTAAAFAWKRMFLNNILNTNQCARELHNPIIYMEMCDPGESQVFQTLLHV